MAISREKFVEIVFRCKISMKNSKFDVIFHRKLPFWWKLAYFLEMLEDFKFCGIWVSSVRQVRCWGGTNLFKLKMSYWYRYHIINIIKGLYTVTVLVMFIALSPSKIKIRKIVTHWKMPSHLHPTFIIALSS